MPGRSVLDRFAALEGSEPFILRRLDGMDGVEISHVLEAKLLGGVVSVAEGVLIGWEGPTCWPSPKMADQTKAPLAWGQAGRLVLLDGQQFSVEGGVEGGSVQWPQRSAVRPRILLSNS